MSEQELFEQAEAIALVGMSGRFPGASNLEQFWHNLQAGVESISFFTDEELAAEGASPTMLNNPSFIKAGAILDHVELFDASFFGFNNREAEVTDPQQRFFLECAWEALEGAGYNTDKFAGRIGVYAGTKMSTYLLNNVSSNLETVKAVGVDRSLMGNDCNYLTTWVSYKLNLNGPSVTVQTACSTSLVAVHLACQSLLNGECDMALAGGVAINIPQKFSYHYREGGINSPDGHCRAFDAQAGGTVGGSGVGVVLLKRLSDALAAGDNIHAVIKGSAINNDGSYRVGFTAPGVRGQAEVVAEALEMASVDPETISYIEAHGTGTALGDPIEITALTEAFRRTTQKKRFCAVGSVKTNVGHLDMAAGVTGLIKSVLALKHRLIPPSLHFQEPNPKIDFASSPFYVNAQLSSWKDGDTPRRAGVSSLGIGGTNAHVIIEEAPPREPSGPSSRSEQLLLLSARSETALDAATTNLAHALKENPELDLADVAYTLQVGRKSFSHRRALISRTITGATEVLESAPSHARLMSGSDEGGQRPVAFIFPGQGAQYVNMAAGLYEEEPLFRRRIDGCAEMLKPLLGLDLRELLYPREDSRTQAVAQLRHTLNAQLALFITEYALAKLLQDWGVRPAAMIGHSLGEYTAACLSGVMTLEECLRLLVARGRLMQQLPGGTMLAVALSEPELEVLLSERLSIAALNGPARSVVSGPADAIAEMEAQLQERGIICQRLQTSHAFHSQMMEPILDPFRKLFREIALKPPHLPYLSNVTGKWITPEEATDPQYWARHLRQTVRFADGLEEAATELRMLFLEVGPGQTLSGLAKRKLSRERSAFVLSSLRQETEEVSDQFFMSRALGQLWVAGVEIDWASRWANERRLRVQLPTYPFERRPYWVERIRPDYQKPGLFKEKQDEPDAPGPQPPPQGEPVTTSISKPLQEVKTLTSPQPALPPEEARRQEILSRLMEIINALTGADTTQINTGATFFEMGVDSLLLIQASQSIQDKFKLKIPFRLFFDELSTISAMVDYLNEMLPSDAFPANIPATTPPQPELVKTPFQEQPPAAVAKQTVFIQNTLSQEEATAPASSAIERVISQQLQVMAQQLEMLQGNYSRVTTAAAAGESDPAQTGAGGLSERDETPAAKSFGAAAAAAEKESLVATPTTQPALDQTRADREVFIPFKQLKGSREGGLDPRQREFLEQLTLRYTSRTRGSKEHTQSYRPVLADNRVSQMFRSLWKEMAYPIVVRRSEGSKIWDIDGNEYVDMAMGFGVCLFGHSPDFITRAIQEQLQEGMQIGPQSYLAGKVAQLICELTGMERVLFCNSGTEAVMTAIRMARAVTGRTTIALFAGAYHGSFDGTLVRGMSVGGKRRAVPVAPGVPGRMAEDVLVLDYDSPESLALLKAHAHELAAVLVEPVQSRQPSLQPGEFLKEVRRLTEKAGVALIFDEVITGFRVHPGGAQAFFDVQADIATYGKVIGGGMPIGVVAGRSEYLDSIDGGMWRFGDDSYPQAGQTFFAGTFCKHPLAMAAAHAVLSHLKVAGPALQQQLNAWTAQLAARLNADFEGRGIPLRVEHFGSLFHFLFTQECKFREIFSFLLIEKGVYVWEGSTRFLSTAHTNEDLELVRRAALESAEQMIEGGFLERTATAQSGSGLSATGIEPATRSVRTESVIASGISDSNSDGARSKGLATKAVRTLPLTETQRQLWILAQLGDDVSRAYNESITLHMRGELNVPALGEAWQKVVNRHEALRTTFSPDGELQRIHPGVEARIEFVDFSHLDEREREDAVAREELAEAGRVFDFVNGPLLRARLIKIEEGYHQLVLTGHHIVTDARSYGVLQGELNTIYSALCQNLPYQLPEPMQYSEFTEEEVRRTAEANLEEAEAFWLEQFSNPPEPLRLPAKTGRTAAHSFNGARYSTRFDNALYQAMKSFNARSGATLFMTLLAAYKVLLHQLTGQEDIVVGINAAAEQAMGSRSLVGFRLHPLALRSRVGDRMSFAEFLASLKMRLLDAYDHQDYPLVKLTRKIKTPKGINPLTLVSTALNLDISGNSQDFYNLKVVTVSNSNGTSKLDLYVNVTEIFGELHFECDYNTDLFDALTIESWFAHLRTILAEALADPARRLKTLSRPPLPALAETEQTVSRRDERPRTNLHRLQLLIWAGQRLNPELPLYTNAEYAVIGARVELEHCRRAFQALIDRSDALRTVFEEHDGTPQQKVLAGLSYEVEYLDFSHGPDPHADLHNWMQQRCAQALDLGQRVFDSVLVKLAEAEYAWYLNIHHIICDARSSMLALQRLSQYYDLSLAGRLDEAPALPPFGRFLKEEQERVGTPLYLEDQIYWESKLAEPPEPLSLYGQMSIVETTLARRISCNLGQERSRKLKEIARALPGISPNAQIVNIFTAMMAAYLHRVSGNRRISIGVPFHNRLSRSAQETIGLFIQIFPLQLTIGDDETLSSLVKQVADETIRAFRHRQYPVVNSGAQRTYDVLIDYVNTNWKWSSESTALPAKFGTWIHPGHGTDLIRMQIQDFLDSGSFTLDLDLNCDLFDDETSGRFIRHFTQAIDAFLEDPSQRASSLDLLTEVEKEEILFEFNRTNRAFDLDQTFVQHFESQALRSPGRIAVSAEGRALTYQELNAAANAAAHQLQAAGVQPETVVSLLARRQIDLLVAILGVFKAGGAYLPLDPFSPPQRMRQILSQSRTSIVLASSEFLEELEASVNILRVDERPHLLSLESLAGKRAHGANPPPAVR